MVHEAITRPLRKEEEIDHRQPRKEWREDELCTDFSCRCGSRKLIFRGVQFINRWDPDDEFIADQVKSDCECSDCGCRFSHFREI